MNYHKGDTVIFVPGENALKGVITERRGDIYTIIHGAVMGTNTRNGRLRALIGGTRYQVHKGKIMRKTK